MASSLLALVLLTIGLLATLSQAKIKKGENGHNMKNGQSGYDCTDQQFNGLSGYVTSPLYSLNYPDNAICVSTITVPSGSAVQLALYDFASEAGSDFLRVRDGNNGGDVMAKLSGKLSPQMIYRSSGRYMTLNFTSDFENSYRGFYARYDAITANDANNPLKTDCPGDNSFTASWGVITSPHWPNEYPPTADCVYQIEVARGKKIQLSVNYFHTEPCCDILKLYDGPRVVKTRILRNMSGNLSEGWTYTSPGNSLTLRFSSDPDNQFEGFSIGYKAV